MHFACSHEYETEDQKKLKLPQMRDEIEIRQKKKKNTKTSKTNKRLKRAFFLEDPLLRDEISQSSQCIGGRFMLNAYA